MTIRMKMADLAQLSRISAPLKRASQHAFQSASWHLTRGSACYSAMIYGKFLRKTRFIGITGSAGKTTTKDLVMGILSESARCGGTRMSFNQATGVARGILQTRLNDDYCVLEVSGGRPHDMDWPLRMFTPDVAVLTLVEREHVKSSIGLDVILKEKRRLVDALPNDGVAVLNIDDPMIRTLGESCTRRIIWVGASDGATVRLIEAQSRWPSPLTLKISFNGTEHHVRTQLHGTHLALSVLSALGVAIACGLDLDRALPALERVRPTTGRMQVVDSEGGITFVRDDWKAPWWSLQAPLAFMREATAKRKIAVIGTLSDYSLSASKAYAKAARNALDAADMVVFTGPHALRALKGANAQDGARIFAFPEIRDAARYLRNELREGDLVLLKGSNKADHLVRLFLDRKRRVECWKSNCRFGRFCTNCDEVYRDVSAVKQIHREGNVAPFPRAGIPSAPVCDYLLIGLGNPGERFDNTVHNVGQAAIDWIVETAGGEWVEDDVGWTSSVSLDGASTVLFKPRAFINASGAAVHRLTETLGIDARQCVVIHDDLDLLLGDVRIKRDGGDAGHLGIRSIIKALGTGTIWRVRIGVRTEGDERSARALVHRVITDDDAARLRDAYARARQLITGRILVKKEIVP